MKLLVTGFDPFGGESVNPAYEAVKLLPDINEGSQIIKLEIPTVFKKRIEVVKEAVENYQPDFVINVGQAGGRACVTVEKVAINLADAGIPDNAGDSPEDESLETAGPDAYFSPLPVKAMMYRVLQLAASSYPNMKAGFIQVPYSSEQVANKDRPLASMPIETIAKSLEHAIEAVVKE